MKDEKKVNTTEEAKKNVKVEEDSEKLTDEQMKQVAGGMREIVHVQGGQCG